MSQHVTTEPGLPRWLTVVLVVVLLLAGIGGAAAFVKTKSEPAKEPEAVTLPIVEVQAIHVGTHALELDLQGVVKPARQVILQPEVGGRIVWHDPALVPGGRVRAGQVLVRIDARDYALALQQQVAQVEAQRLNLEVERGRKRVAEKEWSLFASRRQQAAGQQGTSEADKSQGKPPTKQPLALREPHVKSAEVALQAAKSSVRRAQLTLSRTTLVAPFNAFVQTESVDTGQLVGPQSRLATLVGTDVFWVQVSIPVDKLSYIEWPQADQPGSRARLWIDTGRGRIVRSGRVVRLLGDLDPAGRMARLIIEVRDPFGLEKRTAASTTITAQPDEMDAGEPTRSELPLLLGSYVHVDVEGKQLSDVAEIPRRALRRDNTVWLLNAKNELLIKRVRVVWSTSESVILRGPLATGDRIVISRLTAPVEGMSVRVADGPSKSRAPKKAAQ
jgi:multidrug efflux pump subunit AcrA (membrane-fusion protein)